MIKEYKFVLPNTSYKTIVCNFHKQIMSLCISGILLI